MIAGEATPEDLLEAQLVESCLRDDLRPVEQARAFRSLRDGRGLSVRALAERLHIGHASIVRALALLELPGDVQEAVERGEIAPNTAYELSKVGDPAEPAALAKEAARGGLKRDEIKSRVLRSPAAQVTVELRKGEGLAAIREALADALARVDAELSSGDQAAA
jgi:ParB family chromosome partitioning protein